MMGLFFSLMQWAIFPGIRLVYVSQNVLSPVLNKGDRILVDGLTYKFRRPERGEVVFYDPKSFKIYVPRSGIFGEDWFVVNSKNNIERIVGLPGETVELKKGEVYVNGKKAPAEYSPLVTEQLVFDFKVEVPEDSYCVIYSVAPVEDGPILSLYAETIMKQLEVPRLDSPGIIVTEEWAKASIVHKDEIMGLVRCVYNPPGRRRSLMPASQL
jgi:signal peptidase I